MDGGAAADCAIFVFCVTILLLYNVCYFTTWFQSLKFKWNGRTYLSLWSVGKEARTVWAAAMMEDPKEGITAAQTIRNMVMGTSILAASSALIASQIILLITDTARLDQVERYARSDPITHNSQFMSPQVKMGIALGVLFMSLMAMAQTVRLSVHLGYLIRAVPADPRRAKRLSKISFAINRRASLYFSVGLRLTYVFFPIFLYVLGPLALLIATVIEVIVLFLMDLTPDDLTYHEGLGDETEDAAEAEMEQETTERVRSVALLHASHVTPPPTPAPDAHEDLCQPWPAGGSPTASGNGRVSLAMAPP